MVRATGEKKGGQARKLVPRGGVCTLTDRGKRGGVNFFDENKLSNKDGRGDEKTPAGERRDRRCGTVLWGGPGRRVLKPNTTRNIPDWTL